MLDVNLSDDSLAWTLDARRHVAADRGRGHRPRPRAVPGAEPGPHPAPRPGRRRRRAVSAAGAGRGRTVIEREIKLAAWPGFTLPDLDGVAAGGTDPAPGDRRPRGDLLRHRRPPPRPTGHHPPPPPARGPGGVDPEAPRRRPTWTVGWCGTRSRWWRRRATCPTSWPCSWPPTSAPRRWSRWPGLVTVRRADRRRRRGRAPGRDRRRRGLGHGRRPGRGPVPRARGRDRPRRRRRGGRRGGRAPAPRRGRGGRRPAPSWSRALGPRALAPPELAPPPLPEAPTAAEVVEAALRRSSTRRSSTTTSLALRGEDPEGVHQMRVGARRLRADLRTFRPLLDRSVTDPLRDELKELGAALGAVRDPDVLGERLRDHAGRGARPRRPGRAGPRARPAGPRPRRAQARLRGALGSPRYRRMLDALVAVAEDAADRPRRRPARRRGAPAAGAQAVGAGSGPRSTTWTTTPPTSSLHEVRKRAKQVRYAAEALSAGGRRRPPGGQGRQEGAGRAGGPPGHRGGGGLAAGAGRPRRRRRTVPPSSWARWWPTSGPSGARSGPGGRRRGRRRRTPTAGGGCGDLSRGPDAAGRSRCGPPAGWSCGGGAPSGGGGRPPPPLRRLEPAQGEGRPRRDRRGVRPPRGVGGDRAVLPARARAARPPATWTGRAGPRGCGTGRWRSPTVPSCANDEVDELRWLGLDPALALLSYAHDRALVTEVLGA